MNTEEQIELYIAGLIETKQTAIEQLHKDILSIFPGIPLWFLDGKNADGKIIANPNIGYGQTTLHYADGKSKWFYCVGISANTGGISVYVMNAPNKTYLKTTFGSLLGKARISGYCISFKKLQDIRIDVLQKIIHEALSSNNQNH